jgi:hypothetical protein
VPMINAHRGPFPQSRPAIVPEARILVQSDPKLSVHNRARMPSDGLDRDEVFPLDDGGRPTNR